MVGVFVLGLFYAAGGAVTHAAPVNNEVMLVTPRPASA
jgi:hypothetical protein